MASAVLDASRTYLRAAHPRREVQPRRLAARTWTPSSRRFIAVVALEREVDEVERSVHAALRPEVEAAGELFVLAEATRALEEAASTR